MNNAWFGSQTVNKHLNYLIRTHFIMLYSEKPQEYTDPLGKRVIQNFPCTVISHYKLMQILEKSGNSGQISVYIGSIKPLYI